MTKLTGLAVLAAAALAVTSAYAHDKDKDGGCCMTGAKNNAKMDCTQTYAKLNLSAEQKTKLEALTEKCNKDGCTKESMQAFLKSAEGILTKEQFATLKTECSKMRDKDAKA